MKQKIALFSAILCLLAAAAGCGAPDDKNTGPSSGPSVAETHSSEPLPDAGLISSESLPDAGLASAESGEAEGGRKTVTEFLFPEASGSDVYGTDTIILDASHTDNGYFMIEYNGTAPKAKLQVTAPDGDVYTYTLFPGDATAFSLTRGDGVYHIELLENAYDNMYSLAFSQDLDVTLADEFQPFLYPIQYSWYTSDSPLLEYGMRLSEASADDLDYITCVYHDIISSVTYDRGLAQNVSVDYIPDPEKTLETRKGICFDYASLMTALLRSQGIPAKLEVGYSGTAYHAWISVYTEETGWIDNIIQFDGENWSLMDPTLAASNGEESVGEYIGDGDNYKVKYEY